MLNKIVGFIKRLYQKPETLSHLDNKAFVEQIYHSILLRQVDPIGLKNNLDFLKRGHDRLTLVNILLNSDEYKELQTRVILEEFPAGNFASAIPSRENVERSRGMDRNPKRIAGIDLNTDGQIALLESFKPFYDEMPHHQQTEANKPEYRYVWKNPSYSPSDAIAVYGMIRHFQPKQILEVGCGNSSCIMLDTNDRFFDGKIDFTLVEPYPDYLHSVLWPGDPEKITIIPKQVQDVPLSVFQALNANDILFIDSSHVSKAGSDVNYLYLEVLPKLKPGVVVHIHDVAYPFEYPQEWLDQGRYWNEQYLLRALLIDNQAFDILLFTTQMVEQHAGWIAENMPRFSEIGGSIWLQRTAGNQRGEKA